MKIVNRDINNNFLKYRGNYRIKDNLIILSYGNQGVDRRSDILLSPYSKYLVSFRTTLMVVIDVYYNLKHDDRL